MKKLGKKEEKVAPKATKEKKSDCVACNMTGLQDENTLCPSCNGTGKV